MLNMTAKCQDRHYFNQVATAMLSSLEFIHRKGLVHKDIKVGVHMTCMPSQCMWMSVKDHNLL